MPWFAGRAKLVTLAIAERWGMLSAQSKAQGRPRPIVDMIIAATALESGLLLVTRNVRDYEGLGIEIVNPWEFD